ncbi:hypothetical protein CUJ83_12640 [Methanocella sp. CWC-04]|uniref:TfoX N-terminal domain-containing protein n=1 Tax=Methanooceanicella nereidis TaxID=2052831 RepID=A0AAP2W6Y5_9EURY|nr:TfoX/Sxy family protein [Methanocella sp. CWC-04]MCD1295843.1 hypothetical protein [Methanocella sp. CWC-04]
MEWEKVSDEKSELLGSSIKDLVTEKKKMFGCPVYFVNNNMFTGVHGSNIFLRLSEEDREKILSEFESVSIFEPVKGRKMKEYVVLSPAIFNDNDLFKQWLSRSHEYVSGMPERSPKKSKSKKP